MQHIVAATDLSTRSHLALRRAGLLAREFAAELTVVHVVDDDQERELVELERREAERYLNEITRSLGELRDVRCRVVIATGEAFNGVLETADSSSADLIVMGSHRKQALRDVFTGTTIERVIRTGRVPVLMVNREARHRYERVLVPLDMSEPSAHAIKTAQDLGLVGGGAVILLHAFIATAKSSLLLANAPADQIAEHVASERRKASEELFAFLATHQIRPQDWSYRFEEGRAFEVISQVVRETVPDLVVIGTHGRTGVAKLLLGSVAEEVLRTLNVDILAVPIVR